MSVLFNSMCTCIKIFFLCKLFPSLLYFRFEEIVKKFKVEYHAGGATQNSVKVAQVGAQSCSQYLMHAMLGMTRS